MRFPLERFRKFLEPGALIRLVGAIGSQFNNSLINFALVIFASRVLSPTDFGVFALIITFFYAAQSIIDALLITPAGAYRSVDPKSRRSYAGSLVLLIAMLLGLILLPLALAGIVVVELEGLFVVVALVFVVFSLGESARKLGALFCEPRTVAIVEAVRIVIVVGLFSAAVWLFLRAGASLVSVFAFLACLQAVLLIYMLAMYTRPRRRLLAPIASRHWGAGRWYAISVLFYLAFDIPATLYATTLFGVEYAGYLRIGFAFFAPFNALISVVEIWLAQVFARSEALRERVWTVFSGVLAGSVVLGVLLYAVSEPVLLLAFGAEYLPAKPALTAYIVIAVLSLARCILSAYFKSGNRAREFLFVIAVGSCTAAAASLALGLIAGFPGLLAGMALGHAVSFAAGILVAIRLRERQRGGRARATVLE
jgi:O-antigen/teichoic acid export membrane protein